MRSSYSPLSISAPFYEYLKLLKLHGTERSRSKDARSVDGTWSLLHKGRALTDSAILAPKILLPEPLDQDPHRPPFEKRNTPDFLTACCVDFSIKL